MRTGLFSFVVSAVVSARASTLAATLFVDLRGGADQTAIQPAIDAASGGDTVLVKPGLYVITEPINFKGKRLTVKGVAGPKRTAIIMSGTPTDFQRASVVIFESGEGQESHLEGFTLTGGEGTGTPACGGGVYCVDSSPTLINCTIAGNLATRWWTGPWVAMDGRGGGVYCSGGSPVLTDCTITENWSSEGGGLNCAGGSSPTLINCLIAGNTAGTFRLAMFDLSSGGGLYCGYTDPWGINCCDDCSPLLINCTIAGNSSAFDGGVHCGETSSPTLTNCVVWGNTPDSACGTLSHSITDQEPLFVDPAGGDYRLQPGSPAIDAGTPEGAPTTDIEGHARPCGAGVDLGAYEFGSCSAPGGPSDCNGNGIDDATDLAGGTSEDCNENHVPDECDVASGAYLDFNKNGTPDKCEVESLVVLFLGEWKNVDPNTIDIPRFIIRSEGGQLRIHSFGECEPTDCDWGEVEATVVRGSLSAVYEFGFMTATLTIDILPDGGLRARSVNVFHDQSGRGDYGTHEYFANTVQFVRGNANADAVTDISDAVTILGFLFLGGTINDCQDAADVNDDGKVDISDPVRLLSHLFLGSDRPPDPFGTCGTDLTVDVVDCKTFGKCP